MKKYYVKINSRWTEVCTDKKIAQPLARTYHTTVRTKIENWQVNTVIILAIAVIIIMSVIFTT